MALSEKLYALRRKSGLSQEQLAEQLNVSRQAISKWESGHSTPESDKLLAISQSFHVSLDYLMKDDEKPAGGQSEAAPQNTVRGRSLLGIILCVGGVVCLILWGILSVVDPAFSNEMSESSTVRLDGNGIFLILCVFAMSFGAWLLLNHSAKK